MKIDVQRLCARLAAVPAAFCAPVDPKRIGAVSTEAVVADLFRDRANTPPAADKLVALRVEERLSLHQRRVMVRHLKLVLLASWLLYDDSFTDVDGARLYKLMLDDLRELAKVVAAEACVDDPERREELVRVCVRALRLTPLGESKADAEDRLAGLDSVKRARLLAKARRREAKLHKQRLERLRKQEEEAHRQAARATFED